MFEEIPKNLQYTQGIQYQNQFIFPHRITLNQKPGSAAEDTPLEINGKGVGKGKNRVAFGKVLPAKAPNMMDRKMSNKPISRGAKENIIAEQQLVQPECIP